MYIKTIKEALVLVRKRISLLPIAALTDLLFLFFYGFISAFVLQEMSPFVENIWQLSSKFSSDINFLNDPMKYLLNNSEFMSNINSILIYLIIIALTFCLLWIIFQGAAWFIANKISNIKINLSNYISKFTAVSLFWLILMGISTSAFSLFAFKSLLTLNRTISEETILLFSSIADFILFYFIITSLSLVGRFNFIENLKRTFKLGVLRIHRVIPAYLIIFLALSSLNLILFLISKINSTLSVFLSILVVIPLFTISRIYLIKIIEKIK